MGRRADAPEVKALKQFLRKHDVDNIDAWVHSSIRDEVRDQVTTYIKDELLGAVGYLTTMTGAAMRTLERQLDDSDPMIAQRAAAIIMKYTFEIQKQEAARDDGPERIEFVMGDTFKSGMTKAEEAEEARENPAETKQCHSCGEHKHPDVLTNAKCSSCRSLEQAYHSMDEAFTGNHRDPHLNE